MVLVGNKMIDIKDTGYGAIDGRIVEIDRECDSIVVYEDSSDCFITCNFIFLQPVFEFLELRDTVRVSGSIVCDESDYISIMNECRIKLI